MLNKPTNDDATNNDAMMDRNLALFGQHVELPPEPTAAQQADWKQAPAATSWRRGAFAMNSRRWKILSGLGTAIAATVALAVFLGTPSHHSTVKADTIFAGLRDALGRAFQITFSNIADEGIRSNGTLIVLNDTTAQPGDDDTSGMYLEARVQGEPNSAAAGLDLQATMSFAGTGRDWAYVKTQNVPAQLVAGNPIMQALTNAASDGVLLTLPVRSADGHQTPPEGTPPTLPETTHTTTLGGLTIATSSTASPTAGGHPQMKLSFGIATGDYAASHGHELTATASQQTSTSGSHFGMSMHVQSDNDATGGLVQRLVTGLATADDFQQMATQLQSSSANVTIEPGDNGLHVLTATNVALGDLGGATLRIAYREGDGVQWAELTHVGSADGAMRFERTDVSANDARFNNQRYASDPAIRQVDLENWMNVLSFIGGASGGSNP